jgi:hypothetical protein
MTLDVRNYLMYLRVWLKINVLLRKKYQMAYKPLPDYLTIKT